MLRAVALLSDSASPLRARPVASLVVALIALSCSQPREGPDRFVGEFIARGLAGSTGFTLERDGRARFVTTVSDENGTETEANEGTYRVVGDTALISIRWGDAATDTLRAMVRGDTLVLLDDVLGLTPLYVRR